MIKLSILRLLTAAPIALCLFTIPTFADAATAPGRPEAHLWEPYWASNNMRGEALLFVKQNDAERPTARLLFPPVGDVKLQSASGEKLYEAGKDFVVDAANRTISLPEGSAIPFVTTAGLNPPPGSPNSMGGNIDGKNNLLWAEGHFFHDLQTEATYSHFPVKWDGYNPTPARESLKGTLKKLKDKEPLRIVTLGDSISEGYNASGHVKAAPFMPNYSELVRTNLQTKFGSEVSLKNLAVAGKNSEWGLSQLDQVIAAKPDLVILAFGMNDSGPFSAATYGDNIRKSLDTIRAALPDTEFVLVASMLPNANWNAVRMERFPQYLEVLRTLTGPRVALADLTSVWTDLSAKKQYLDMTGNGLNHPNDFGHRLYAQVILGLFG